MAQEIFKNHDLAFSGRPSLYAIQKFTNNIDIAFVPYGKYWRELRKIALLELLTIKRVESFEGIREQEVGIIVDKIAKASSSLVDLSSLTFCLTNSVVCRVAFDQRNDRRFEGILNQLQSLAAEFNIADYFPWLRMVNKINGVDREIGKCKSEFEAFFDEVILDHRMKKSDSEREEDIVDVLLRIQKDPRHSIELTMDHIKGVLLDIFVAGTDTSSATIVWTMTELIRNPKVLEKLQREVREIGAGKQAIQEKDLPNLTYLKLVIKESLRLHPPVPLLLPRETTTNCSISEKWEIPVKTRVIINAIALSMDPEYWEKPEIFWPERFASENKIDYRGQHFGYLPFGAGRRICPGINFGLQVVELALANLVFRFDWELPEGMKAEDIDMEEALGIVVQKKVHLCLLAKSVMV